MLGSNPAKSRRRGATTTSSRSTRTSSRSFRRTGTFFRPGSWPRGRSARLTGSNPAPWSGENEWKHLTEGQMISVDEKLVEFLTDRMSSSSNSNSSTLALLELLFSSSPSTNFSSHLKKGMQPWTCVTIIRRLGSPTRDLLSRSRTVFGVSIRGLSHFYC